MEDTKNKFVDVAAQLQFFFTKGVSFLFMSKHFFDISVNIISFSNGAPFCVAKRYFGHASLNKGDHAKALQ